jgi:mannosyl-oligosaccharide alpha-1,2-mannosidase
MVVLAEIGSLSVEFTRLAQLTLEPKYYDAVARITDALEEYQDKTRLKGMWPTQLDASGCKAIDYSSSLDSSEQEPLNYSDSSNEETTKDVGTGIGKTPEVERTEKNATKMVPLDLPKPIEFHVEDAPTKGKIKSSEKGRATDDTLAKKSPTKIKRQLEDPSADGSDPVESVAEESRSLPSLGPECEEQGLVSGSDYRTEKYTLGGESDSTYEYLPKVSSNPF